MLAGDEVAAVGLGDRRSGNLPFGCRGERRISGDALYQGFAARQFAVGKRLRSIRSCHFPGCGDEF